MNNATKLTGAAAVAAALVTLLSLVLEWNVSLEDKGVLTAGLGVAIGWVIQRYDMWRTVERNNDDVS